MAMTRAESVRLMLCTDRLEHLCKTMDEIADIVRYMANRDSADRKESEKDCLNSKQEWDLKDGTKTTAIL